MTRYARTYVVRSTRLARTYHGPILSCSKQSSHETDAGRTRARLRGRATAERDRRGAGGPRVSAGLALDEAKA